MIYMQLHGREKKNSSSLPVTATSLFASRSHTSYVVVAAAAQGNTTEENTPTEFQHGSNQEALGLEARQERDQ
jgi:hypothetical protein